jgi:hypothetical protein
MSLDTALSQVHKNVPECVAVGFVDIKTGMLLGIKTADSHPREIIDLVAAATGDLFQGSNVTQIERMFKKARGIKDSDNHHYFQEVLVLSDNLIHVFMRCKKNEEMVLVCVTRGSANLGMVLAKTRASLPNVEAQA